MDITVDKFVARKNNTLQGYFTVYFNELGLEIQGFSLHAKNSSTWIEFPAKRPANSTDKWPKVIVFYDKRKEREFIEMVKKELKQLINSDDGVY